MINSINSRLNIDLSRFERIQSMRPDGKPVIGGQETTEKQTSIQGETYTINVLEDLDVSIPDNVKAAMDKTIEEIGYNPYIIEVPPGESVLKTLFSTSIGWLQVNQYVRERMGAPQEEWITLEDIPSAQKYADAALEYINDPDQYPLSQEMREKETVFFEALMKNLEAFSDLEWYRL